MRTICKSKMITIHRLYTINVHTYFEQRYCFESQRTMSRAMTGIIHAIVFKITFTEL